MPDLEQRVSELEARNRELEQKLQALAEAVIALLPPTPELTQGQWLRQRIQEVVEHGLVLDLKQLMAEIKTPDLFWELALAVFPNAREKRILQSRDRAQFYSLHTDYEHENPRLQALGRELALELCFRTQPDSKHRLW